MEVKKMFDIETLYQRTYLVNGELKKWTKGLLPIITPIKGYKEDDIIGYYPSMKGEDALESLESAVRAYDKGKGVWPTASVEERIKCIEAFVDLMKRERAIVVSYLMWEIGKNLSDASKEFDRTIQYIEDTIETLRSINKSSDDIISVDGINACIRRAPLGVVLCMGPFNYPLNETFTTLIPALIMGNTVIVKPAKYGILLWEPLLKCFRDAFPAGVVNFIYGDGRTIISPIMESGKIDVLAFIGSSGVANTLEKMHPKPNRLKTVYGLGAKNPAIILSDADIDNAVNECLAGSLSYNGQRCTALKILFVHDSIADNFVNKFSSAVEGLTLGLPWDNAKITPLPEENKTKYMDDYVQDAVKFGANVMNAGGNTWVDNLYVPAVLYPVHSDSKIYNEEQFGPVVPIVKFSSVDEIVSYIENSNFGQQISIFGKNASTIANLLDFLVNQVSRVNINSQCQRGPDEFPFTGRKDSAVGTLSVSDALRVFSQRTLVAYSTNGNADNATIMDEIMTKNLSKFMPKH